MLQIHLPGTPTVGVFCTDKQQGLQDRMILVLRWSLKQQAHKNLSWFKPLNEGNSPMFGGLLLSKNKCYKG
jgi:hypothetical protein